MAKKQYWTVQTDDGGHDLSYSYAFWTGKSVLCIDGEELVQKLKPFRLPQGDFPSRRRAVRAGGLGERQGRDHLPRQDGAGTVGKRRGRFRKQRGKAGDHTLK